MLFFACQFLMNRITSNAIYCLVDCCYVIDICYLMAMVTKATSYEPKEKQNSDIDTYIFQVYNVCIL